MIFRLHKSVFNILKENVHEALEYIQNINQDNDQIAFNIKDEDIQEVQLLINDEIVLNGIDNQETVNDLGIKLYKLYDEILYQKQSK